MIFGKVHKGTAKVMDVSKGRIENLTQYASKQKKLPKGAVTPKRAV
ncbi:hypothetical protein [Thermoactinomyces sp. DSM 45892]|nr:hypothetical protein [Thermoactinomyces sp. DSM 45892]SDY88571.1 hypothetical protein SAMN05444416_109170 [Thermoactinomyces sp. DSM 45892]